MMDELNELDLAVLRGKAIMEWYDNAFGNPDPQIEDAMVDLIAYREAGKETTTTGDE
jgi:hypothetical protein